MIRRRHPYQPQDEIIDLFSGLTARRCEMYDAIRVRYDVLRLFVNIVGTALVFILHLRPEKKVCYVAFVISANELLMCI